ncbi:MAG: histidine kinase [Acidobacteria bacterium]|nr:histidine kinase [Acidobacteriota bacterium]
MEIRRALSRLWIRLLAFNVLLIFVPVAGALFLGTYERQLLDAQERTMVQEGRLLAAALAARGPLNAGDARTILRELGQRHETRLRIVGREGQLLADSARLGPRREPGGHPAPHPGPPAESFLYRLGSLPFRLLHKLRAPTPPQPGDLYDRNDRLMGPELRAALAGRYGATTRVSAGASPKVTLYSAIPIRGVDGIDGAVLVSQSTYRIRRTLYAVRLGIFKVFLASLLAALILSALVATTIARPLSRLRRRAEDLVDRRGRLRGTFRPARRLDEIGDLQRALALLTERLDHHIRLTESFSADVSHEFKNPLASIRSATELALSSDDPRERRHLLELTQREVSRMERLLSGVREISRVDAGMENEERTTVILDSLLAAVVEAFRLRYPPGRPAFLLALAQENIRVHASPDRLTQVLENLLDNAAGFSPPGGTVTVSLAADAGHAVLSVADQGPGIPREHLDRVFSRFFTLRENGPAEHTGLGLSIAKAIVEAYGGSITARNRDAGGTVFEVRLPRGGRAPENTPPR